MTGELTAKRLELLRELVPAATRVAVLLNPSNAENPESEIEAAARSIGLKVRVLKARTVREINAAFATRLSGLTLSSSASIPSSTVAMSNWSTWRRATRCRRRIRGGNLPRLAELMSYGANIVDAWRQAGTYAGRILKGAKPADLLVVQSSKFELVFNLQAATMLGLSVPDKLLVAADEVIE